MIGTIFQFGTEIIEVRIDGTNATFRTRSSYGGFVPIDALRIDKSGVIKEHPDLENNILWRNIAIERFKIKLKSYPTEEQRMQYIIDDLKKFGYVALYYQKAGHRPVKLN